MKTFVTAAAAFAGLGLTSAAGCPYAEAALQGRADAGGEGAQGTSGDFLAQYEVDDSNGFLTSDVGGPIDDQGTLKAGVRGPALLEDFKFRQKIQHFDHERVPERAVHARGAGARGTFTSYADWSNLTAASFLGGAGKATDTFVRFSTVAGSRGSADLARDIHGFATRLFTDSGNLDIVGNNVPVFFIQDAIQFPDLIHSVKPSPDNEIPQAATAHDSAWDFFSSQPSTLHTLFWAMSGHGIPRSYRHMDGFGVHSYRLVTDKGDSKLIKWHWKSKQGRASLVWEEAQAASGKNADFHRQDLFDAIESGNGPEWELCVQVVEEADALSFGFDLLDPTKIIPVEFAPLNCLGLMKLDANPRNYFAETEQIMFQPAHIVRGIDFTDDPLLQGRIYSYLDTQLNRHGGPNFEQLPINQPRVPVHNNNRDGSSQHFIHTNKAAYSPNTLNNAMPAQANFTTGRGFFTAPIRKVEGGLTNELSSTFADHWTQPRLFYNSLSAVEKQFLINAMRFETSHLQSATVKRNVLAQLNRVSHELAVAVADVLGMAAPASDPQYYHDNKTSDVGSFTYPLPSAKTLRVGILTSIQSADGLAQAASLKDALGRQGIVAVVVAESLGASGGVDQTYSAADATGFDGLVVTAGAAGLIAPNSTAATKSTLYPAGRPAQIVVDGYRWGKPVAGLGAGSGALRSVLPSGGSGKGVFYAAAADAAFVSDFEEGLKMFKFLDRFPVDQ